MTLLGGARTHRNVEYGEIAFHELMRLDPNNSTGTRAAAMVLMSQIYFLAGRFEDAERVRGEMKSRGIKKVPGVTKVEIGDELHAFVCDDSMHPAMKEIRALNEKLHAQMVAEAGYQPDVSQVTYDESEQEKQNRLCEHSERLALCYALLRTPDSSEPIRMFKNLRVCADCHEATCIVSGLLNRTIIVKDANRWHSFEAGKCSCKGFY